MADVYDALKPTLAVSKAIGLGPFSFDSEERKLKTSNLGLALNFLVLLLYSGNSGWALYILLFVDNDSKNKDDVSEVNKKCQVACGVGVTVVTMVLMMIQRKKVVAVVNSVHQIDGEMKKLGITLPYDYMGKVSFIQMVCLLVFLVFLTLHASFIWFEQDQIAAEWIASLAPAIYNFIMEFQFIGGALLLKKHFTLLNDYLISFTGKASSAVVARKELTDSYTDGNDTFLGPKLIDTSFIAWDGNFSRFRPRKETVNGTPEKQTLVSNIKVFRKVHSNLCDVKEHLNSAYSLQLLASVAQAFVIITSDLYLLFTSLNDSGLARLAWLTYPVVWTLTHVLELIFVVVSCTKTSKQANQTAVIVHKLLARDCDPDLRNQLKLFSIQLLHRKISFSACGFFTLDMTLLQAIIGAATTYLVILIQFHLGQKPPQ